MHENQQPQTEAFELSAAEREAIEHEKHHYEDPRAASIEALKIVQKQRGWVPGWRDLRDRRRAGYSGERCRRRRHILQPDLPPAGRSPCDPLL
ncbi:NADH dehydrogenase subunit E [Citrobacter koseri]|uniref:NADH dehydrogenase subunit E n=1 Tax=Citrobacter koseri TaxID=545 RepID=A0A2X2XQX9_CITKO|nr:NADH dehydrogenase subunit E [Citrobacter koseri]